MEKELLHLLREIALRYGIVTGGDGNAVAADDAPQISAPQDVMTLLAWEMEPLRQEQLRVLNLNTRNRVTSQTVVYQGTVNSCSVRPAEVLRQAVIENAPSVIVVHNHPSGDPTPSPEDVCTTRDLVTAGKILDVAMLDHVIIGSNGRFTSLRETGQGFDGQ